MKTWPIVAILVGAGVAHARPKPVKPAVCMPSYFERGRVVVSKGSTLACWVTDSDAEKCVAVPQTGAPRYARGPASAAPKVELRKQGGQLSACRGAKCKKLGKQVVAALAQAKADGEADDRRDQPTVKLSPDRKMLVVGHTAFNLVNDKVLELQPPKEYENKVTKGGFLGADFVGRLLIANWADCAGPCGMTVVVDSNGNNTGAWFPSGKGFVLDDKRVAILSTESESVVTIIEVATAKQLGTLKVGDGAAENVIGGVIDAQTMVIVAPAEDAWKMQWLSFPVGKAPSFGLTKTISKCP